MENENTGFENIYVVAAEVAAKPDSEMWGVAKGGFLYCIVPTIDAENAAKNARLALEEDNYQVVEIEEVVKFNNMEWESEEVENNYKELAFDALKANDVIYGPFFIYNEDD